jgi:nucleoside-diphosphate-sugar epimerase
VSDANGAAAPERVRDVRVLVTGGTGFLGTRLVHRLLSERVAVRVLVRSPAKAKPLIDDGAEVVVGEITDEQAVAASLEDVSVVYHLAGRLLIPGIQPDEYRRTHVEGTRLLLSHCLRQSGLERFVHCSTTGVLGATGDRPADESAPVRPTNIYEATKAEAETAVRSAWPDGFPAVIVRPGLVYGPGDLHLLGFFRAVLRRRFRPIGSRPVRLHPIYIDDMIEALVACSRCPGAVGECFHIAGRESVPLAALAEAIARAGGTSLPSGRIPLPAARTAAFVGDRLPPKLRRSAPLTRTRLDFLIHSRVYDVEKARRVLDFAATTDLQTGIATTLAWYRRQGLLPDGRVVVAD